MTQNLYQLQALGGSRGPKERTAASGTQQAGHESVLLRRPPEAVPGEQRAAGGRPAPEHSYLGSENLVTTTTSLVPGKPAENTCTGPPVRSGRDWAGPSSDSPAAQAGNMRVCARSGGEGSGASNGNPSSVALGPEQGKGDREGQMSSGWAAVSGKANRGAHAVCRTPVGLASSPTRDLVLLSIHGTGHSGHPDRVLYVLHVLAQVGAPDGDTGASVYRPRQRLHLFQDTGCSPPPTSQALAARRGRPSLPPSGPLDPQHPPPSSKGSGEEGTRQRFNTPSG